MKIHQRVHIDAEPAAVWPFVANPVLMSLWNSNIMAVERDSPQPVRQGERFAVTYKLGAKERESEVEILDCSEPLRVTYSHHLAPINRIAQARETYRMTEQNPGTLVELELDIDITGLPWIFRIPLQLFTRRGIRINSTYLDKLKQSVEENTKP